MRARVGRIIRGAMTTGTKIGVCCACAKVLIAGFVFEHIPEPKNPWLLIITGFTIVLRPFVAIGLGVAAISAVRSNR